MAKKPPARWSPGLHQRAKRDRFLWLLLPALLLVMFAAYHPAWHGGLLWDDDDHVTRAELRSAAGLGRIWFEVGATQQYYPVVHTAFWVLHRVAGDDTLGYHLVNIALHALSAFLLGVILRRLAIPIGAAVLSAVIFALHPVQVESVAWITELKNTLSGVLYLAAALTYLRFDRARRTRDHALALGLFVLALLAKSVTATLPAGLLVVWWWQRGRLEWRRDVVPLVPFFALGLSAGLMTAWVERTFIGAQGVEYQLTLVERVLVAGRATWFYLATLAWPSNLIFIYPRWQVSQAAWWQYLFPFGVVVLLAALWAVRHRSRAPLAAVLFFILTLSPALGFINVYPFRFSFVADHFQYLASIGIIAFVAAGVVSLAGRWRVRAAAATTTLVVGLGALLAMLTWQQSREYVDAEILYRVTIARNPACWMAYNNLGALKLHAGAAELREAIAAIQTSLQINPDNPEALNNLGVAWQALGRFEDARSAHARAVALSPGFADAHNNLGAALQLLGRLDEAATEFREAIRLKPRVANAHHNLGMVLTLEGQIDAAIAEITEALRLDPNDAEAYLSLGNALKRLGRPEDALAQYLKAARLKPGYAEARHNAGSVLEQLGRHAEAVAAYQDAIRLKPDSARSHDGLGHVLFRMGRRDEAVTEFEAALRLQPDYEPAHFNLANALLDLGRVEAAAAEYRLALKYEPAPGSAETHNNFGTALAQLGRISEAVTEFEEALRIKPDFADARANLARAKRRE
jgi:tetratricopeptide (TPR) repeat protein